MRTTEAAVEAIIDIDPLITDITPFIEIANNMVTAHCSDLDDDTAELVERWLSAHFICIRDPRTISETVKSVGEAYQSKVDLGLNCSHYGQMAMTIDSTGNLSSWNDAVVKGTKKTATLNWMGLTETEIEQL